MDFQTATDKLMSCGVTLADIAKAAGVTHQTIRRARLAPTSSARLRPPAKWPTIVARVARDRVAALDSCSAELSSLAEAVEAQNNHS